MKTHPSYKIKSVKHDNFDRIHVVFKDGSEYFLYPDDIVIANTISHYINEKALRFARQ